MSGALAVELTADVRAFPSSAAKPGTFSLASAAGLLEELQAAVAVAGDAERPALYALLAEAYGGIAGSPISLAMVTFGR